MGVKIFPVLIGSTYGQAKLQILAEETGGVFYYAATVEEIRNAIFGVQEDFYRENGEELYRFTSYKDFDVWELESDRSVQFRVSDYLQ